MSFLWLFSFAVCFTGLLVGLNLAGLRRRGDEHVMLVAVESLEPEASSVKVRRWLEEVGERWSAGKVLAVGARLVERGELEEYRLPGGPERGGCDRQMYRTKKEDGP